MNELEIQTFTGMTNIAQAANHLIQSAGAQLVVKQGSTVQLCSTPGRMLPCPRLSLSQCLQDRHGGCVQRRFCSPMCADERTRAGVT